MDLNTCSLTSLIRLSDLNEVLQEDSHVTRELPQKVNVHDLMLEVMASLKMQITDKRLDVKIDRKSKIKVFVRPLVFQQIFYNILRNAIESSYMEDEIIVATLLKDYNYGGRSSTQLRVRVIDYGKSMSEDQISALLHNRPSLIALNTHAEGYSNGTKTG